MPTINRRSGSRILKMGNALAEPLTRNRDRGVELSPREGAPDGEVRVLCFDAPVEEPDWLATDVMARYAEGTAWRDIVVLTHRNDVLASVWEHLREHDVLVEIVGIGGLLWLSEIALMVVTPKVLADPLVNAEVAGLLTGERWRLGLADLVVLVRRARGLAPGEAAEEPLPLPKELAELVPRADPTCAPSLLDAMNDPGQVAISNEGGARLERFTSELAELCRHLGEPVPELVRRATSWIGLEAE